MPKTQDSFSRSWAERGEDGLVAGQGREAGWMGAARAKPWCCRRPLRIRLCGVGLGLVVALLLARLLLCYVAGSKVQW